MAGNYNVDDILAEINSKKQKTQGNSYESFKKQEPIKEKGQVPFQLAGMTSDFTPPVVEETIRKKPPQKEKRIEKKAEVKEKRVPRFDEEDDSFTLTVGLKKTSDGKRIPDEGSRTIVMPAVKELNSKLAENRQEKIKEFMSKSAFDDGFDFGEEEKEEFKSSLGLKAKGRKKGHAEKERKEKVREKDFDVESAETEFNSMRDVMDVSDEIAVEKRRAVTRCVSTGIIFLSLFYLSLCNLYPLPLLSPFCPENNMKLFLLCNLILLLASALIQNSAIGNGLVSFFTMKSDNDSPAALATLAVITHGTFLVFKENYIFTGEAHLFFSVAGLILFMNAVGKLMLISRISTNFKIASCGKELTGEYLVEDSLLADSLSEGQGFDNACISYGKKVKFPTDFMALSYTDDYFENSGRIITPLFVGFGVVISILSLLLFDYTASQAFTVFTVVMCMASPITATLAGALPLFKASKQLSMEGTFVSGYEAVDMFENVNGVVINSNELYKPKDVVLHGIKAFGDCRVDNAIVDAASLMNASGGLLSEVFLDVIERKISMLKKVDSIKSYDGGIGGNCEGASILMGSRSLMERFSVSLPSKEFETKFLKDGRDLIYMSTDGVLSALIVVSYNPDEDALYYLKKLRRYAPALIVRTDDPNINGEKIAYDFGYPEEYVDVVSQENFEKLDNVRKDCERDRAYAMGTGIGSRIRLICALVSLKKNIVTATVMQMASLILGYALVALLSFTGNISMMGFLQIIIYQLFWGLSIMAVSSMGKY